jgi:hypothetical protein
VTFGPQACTPAEEPLSKLGRQELKSWSAKVVVGSPTVFGLFLPRILWPSFVLACPFYRRKLRLAHVHIAAVAVGLLGEMRVVQLDHVQPLHVRDAIHGETLTTELFPQGFQGRLEQTFVARELVGLEQTAVLLVLGHEVVSHPEKPWSFAGFGLP